jgi:hypothetical protein
VPCNQLIASALLGAGDGRTEYAKLPDALRKLKHIGIIPYAIGILRVWMKLPYGDAVYFTYGFWLFVWNSLNLLSKNWHRKRAFK